MPQLREQKSVTTRWYINGGVPGFDLSSLPRCEGIAKTTGKRCKRAALKGQKLCGIHCIDGYTPSAPKHNNNAIKTGLHTAAARAERKEVNELIAESNAFINEILGK